MGYNSKSEAASLIVKGCVGVIEAVAFDFDLTLVDSSQGIWATICALADELGLRKPSLDEVKATIGYSLKDAMAGFWGRLGDGWVERYREIFAAQHYQGVVPLPGVIETLKTLKSRGIGVAVATNRLSPDDVVNASGVGAVCSVIVGIRTLPSKPSGAIISEAFRLLGVDPQSSAYVGDTDIDMIAAANAGCMPIGVTTGNHSAADLQKAGARHVLSSVVELPDLLAGLE
ncbi:putative phosphatase [Jonquetella anthropi DSM 22815]|uniref:Putative phosphatase n=1 Tax=Jonquetella anthropi DSM 22815 TaxID=885272 RepID=H0ULF3_9BACT|nr:putative phosphatase [Jonquetella anthropi DSM 22815]